MQGLTTEMNYDYGTPNNRSSLKASQAKNVIASACHIK